MSRLTTPMAILIGAALVAAAILVVGHWELVMRPEGAVFRLNRWTGEVRACAPTFVPWEKDSDHEGRFTAVCGH
jgi:hypothetical protein